MLSKVWFISFNGISTLVYCFIAKATHIEGQQLYDLTHGWEIKGFIPFAMVLVRKWT